MYSKEELSSKEIPELLGIAKEFGVEVNEDSNIEDVIYAILDRQAEVEGSKNPLGTKRRRTRIVKKDTEPRLYRKRQRRRKLRYEEKQNSQRRRC